MAKKVSVIKELRWEAAHRLVKGYSDKCAHLHGHSYSAQVEVGFILHKETENLFDKYDFVQDFSCFKNLKTWIDSNWDHAVLVASEDKELLSFLFEAKQRHYIFNGVNPTSEIMAKVLFDEANELALSREMLQVFSVRIRETCTSEACYSSLDFNKSSSEE